MPRLPRIYLENTLYYITGRGAHNENIFNDSEDYKMFLELLKKYKEQYGFKMFAFVLMPDHFHLLLELPGQKEEGLRGGLSEIMHDQNSAYTKYFNGKYNRKGHLFRERFKAALVEKEPYLLKLTAYIHLNPQRLNLPQDSKEYPYSSYAVYLDKEVQFTSLMKAEKEEIFNLLGAQSYEQFAEQLSKDADYLNMHKYLQKSRVLGNKDFQAKVEAALADFSKKEKEEEPAGLSLGAKIGLITFMIVLVGSGVTYLLKLTLKEKPSVSQVKREPAKEIDTEELNGTEWHIRLIPVSGGKEEADMISFVQHKFVSGKLSSKGYSAQNYSLAIEDGKTLTWETIQTGQDGTASWRGEMEEGNMKGMLSLRDKSGKTQDFSFISVAHRRNK